MLIPIETMRRIINIFVTDLLGFSSLLVNHLQPASRHIFLLLLLTSPLTSFVKELSEKWYFFHVSHFGPSTKISQEVIRIVWKCTCPLREVGCLRMQHSTDWNLPLWESAISRECSSGWPAQILRVSRYVIRWFRAVFVLMVTGKIFKAWHLVWSSVLLWTWMHQMRSPFTVTWYRSDLQFACY